MSRASRRWPPDSVVGVRRAGSSSWRFAHGVEQWPHAVLYVRDALGLYVEPALGVSPVLIEKLPDRSALLESSARAEAARGRAKWWETVVKYESRSHFDPGDQDQAARYEQVLEYGRAIDPVTSSVLSGTALQPAAQAVFDDACSWGGSVDPPNARDVTNQRKTFAWEVVRDTAEAVAAVHGVDVGVIDGAASILLVEGVWWDLVAPRFALCSLAAADDPNVAGEMLQSVFESGLSAG
jgi:hypothetical protein